MDFDGVLRSGRWYLAMRVPEGKVYSEPQRLHLKPLDYNSIGVLVGMPNHETGAGGLGYAFIPWEMWGRFYLYPLDEAKAAELDAGEQRREGE